MTMVVEIGAGVAFGSMALLADGITGHPRLALAISAFAYFYTRRHAKDARFNFGTGKVTPWRPLPARSCSFSLPSL